MFYESERWTNLTIRCACIIPPVSILGINRHRCQSRLKYLVGSNVIGALGAALNERLKGAGLPSACAECVAFITGRGSHLGVTDAKLGATDQEELELLIIGDQFTRTRISEAQFGGVVNSFQSQNAGHIPSPGGFFSPFS